MNSKGRKKEGLCVNREIVKYIYLAGAVLCGYFGPALIFHLAVYSGFIEAGDGGNVSRQSLNLFFAGNIWALILFLPVGIAGLFMRPEIGSPQKIIQTNLLFSPGVIPCLYAIFALIAYF